MPIPPNITRNHVIEGIVDFTAGFAHDFGPSTAYDLLWDGQRYPPKAILGLAARHATGQVLVPADFSGGESSQCFRILRRLGFEIVPKLDQDGVGPPQRAVVAWVLQANPKLFRLDEYFSRHTLVYWNFPKFANQVKLGMPVFFKRTGPGGGLVARGTVTELPATHNQVSKPEFLRDDLWDVPIPTDLLYIGVALEEVRLTLEDHLVPTRTLEAVPELAGHPLVTVRQGTVFRLSADQLIGVYREWGQESTDAGTSRGEAEEGNRVLVTHRRIERNRKLIEDKKNAFRQEHGKLFCEVCGEDHSRYYGSLWSERAIEAHHLKPLSELAQACRTRLEDLILACRNCHALIHQSSDVEGNLLRLQQHFAAQTPTAD